ncbi:S8 family serine peptidase [Spirosoma taeanense]|uniref:S8 family serine peptidase n=1 Tax=Spirosoma taeanense TaxID=2735870 RepID=A0A6M5Y2L2_9BACT|nr:S8 family serine peptidase [Spirosoma taeanense]QJW87955.1 S8 family serine peptidase [Spirosoma taeanense]
MRLGNNSTLPVSRSLKLDRILQQLADGASPDRFKKDGKSLLRIRDNKVLVTATAEGNADLVADQLRSLGADVTGVYNTAVSAYVPLSQLKAAGQLTGLRSLVASQPTLLAAAAMPVIGQCDTALRSNLVRQLRGFTGRGLKIGVLSDSYNNLGGAAAGVANDELPGPGNPNGYTTPVEIIEEYFGTDGIDEGRAMMELIHDAAPAATLAFASAFNGEAEFAQNIIRLKNAGCDIIVDDVYYLDEPYFQNGIVAQAVNQVRDAGIHYFSSAGNSSDYSYEHAFFPGPKVSVPGLGDYTMHKFNVQQPFQPLLVPPGAYVYDWLQWSDPYGGNVQSDLDMLLVDANGNILSASLYNNIANRQPLEVVYYANETDQPQLVFLLIGLYTGPAPKLIKYISYGTELFVNSGDYPGLGASTIVGHSNAEGANSVGAARFTQTPAYGVNPPIIEPFSSLGGTPLLFDDNGNRYQSPKDTRKPDFTAPDGGNTSFFYADWSGDADALPNFFGTSAAAPNAAAAAALMLEAWKGTRPDPLTLRKVMQKTAVDMNNPYNGNGNDKGFDEATGYGLVDALAAVDAVTKLTGGARLIAENSGLRIDMGANPVIGDQLEATIRGVAGKPLTIALTTADGRSIISQTVEQADAEQKVRIPLNRQSTGVYLLRIHTLTESRTIKVIR